MSEVLTKYGNLKGVITPTFYPNGSLKECILEEYNEIETRYGILVPSYEQYDVRKKYTRSISFYENGDIEGIALQKQKKITTKVGSIPAEFITFYNNGSIKRIFPLNGKLSGYWSEDDEYNLAEEVELNVKTGILKTKFVGIQLYEDESVKSITLWSKDTINVFSPIGYIDLRNGISFYNDGKIKSLEPKNPTLIKTAIGGIKAYDTNVLGINGDSNSLTFSEDGKITSLVSATDEIAIVDRSGNRSIVKQTLKQNLFNNDVMDVIPLKVEFFEDKVRFNNDVKSEYVIKDNIFIVDHKQYDEQSMCGNCDECGGCT